MNLAKHVWKKHAGLEIPDEMDEGAAGYVGEVREYFSVRLSLSPEVTTGQMNWWAGLSRAWSSFKTQKNIDDDTELSDYVGGQIRAVKYMTELLVASNAYYTWENYGRFWDTDHFPIPYASIVPGVKTTYFCILHYSNYRPLEHHPNMSGGCKRY
jgi:hypothetical protein